MTGDVWSRLLETIFAWWPWGELVSSAAMVASGVLLVLILRNAVAACALVAAIAIAAFGILDLLGRANAIPVFSDQQEVSRVAAYVVYDVAVVGSLWLIWRRIRRPPPAAPSA